MTGHSTHCALERSQGYAECDCMQVPKETKICPQCDCLACICPKSMGDIVRDVIRDVNQANPNVIEQAPEIERDY